jgi:outer membrane receptor protein involved in Fe transport
MMLSALFLTLFMAAETVTGVVQDSNGGVIPGASVAVRSQSGGEQRTTTGPDGRFILEAASLESATLVVRAEGFAEKQQPLTSGSTDLQVILSPATLFETVVVSATRTEQRLGNVPASVSVLPSEVIRSSPAVVADDVLRQVPTFSLFRRTSSLVAQPTTQGVSLRGIGPSGQSRTLVLLDGVPVNDPFGGWVYWTRVPLLSVDQIEITEDTASSLYGNYAMGGVINILTSRPSRRTIEIQPQYGNKSSPKFDFFASDRWNKLGAAVEGSFFNTDGFPIVAARERGPIDNNGKVDYRNVTAKVEYDPSPGVHTFFRAGYFTEDRVNAKVGEVNDTKWTAVSGGVRAQLPDRSTLQGTLFVDDEDAHFNFLAVTNAATTRNAVRLATDQRVPVNGIGGSAQWSKVLGASHVLNVGADVRQVEGDSEEDAYVAAVPTVITGVTQAATLSVRRISGGTQRSLGAFVSDVFTPVPKLVLTLSGRVDRWKNYNGHNRETTVATGLPTANNKDSIPDRDDTVFSPRAAALVHVTDKVTAWAAVNSGFRAPTLTELYRQFSVGPLTTRPNSDLGPERLVGGEAGLNFAPARNLTARMTWFDNRMKDPVSNVTMTPSQPNFATVCVGLAAGSCVQKQNLGRTKIQGVQTDVEYRFGTFLRFTAAYMRNEAKVTDGGVVNEALVGKYLPQVPRHRGSLQVAYSDPKYAIVAFSVQFVGRQFNDDQNVNFIPVETLTAEGYAADTPAGLPGYSSMDLTVARDIGPNLQVFFGVQNLADTVYFVQTNPSTIGTPRLVNGGVRIRWSGR